MSFPRRHIVNGQGIVVEPTGPYTHSLWLEGPQPPRETFYGLSRIGRQWTITRYLAERFGIAFVGFGVGIATSKRGAIQLAVADYQSQEKAT